MNIFLILHSFFLTYSTTEHNYLLITFFLKMQFTWNNFRVVIINGRNGNIVYFLHRLLCRINYRGIYVQASWVEALRFERWSFIGGIKDNGEMRQDEAPLTCCLLASFLWECLALFATDRPLWDECTALTTNTYHSDQLIYFLRFLFRVR